MRGYVCNCGHLGKRISKGFGGNEDILLLPRTVVGLLKVQITPEEKTMNNGVKIEIFPYLV